MNINPFSIFKKKKQIAQKMSATTNKPNTLKPPTLVKPNPDDYNRGFKDYKSRLDEALTY